MVLVEQASACTTSANMTDVAGASVLEGDQAVFANPRRAVDGVCDENDHVESLVFDGL